MRIIAVESEKQPAVWLEVPTPVPARHEILLKVQYVGVCHSDTHVQEGGFHMGGRGFLKSSGVTHPLVLGHEVVGEVVAVGEDVTTVSPGDVRLVFPWIGCGECIRCRQGNENFCANSQTLGVRRFGGFSDFIHVPHERYLVDIEGLDPQWAATLACSGVTCYSAVNKVLPLDRDDPIVVVGTGGLGLTAIAILKAQGHANIAAVDVSDERLAIARDLGATTTVNSAKDRAAERLIEATGGPVLAVIDFVNNGDTVRLGFDALAKGGTLVQVGLFGGEMTLPTALMPIKALTLRGSFVGNLEELKELVKMAKTGLIPKIPVISGVLDVATVNQTLSGLNAGKVSGRVVLSPADFLSEAAGGR